MHFYNEFDPMAAQWLRELMAAGEIPEGDVDERSITEVQPSDLKGYVQCHFFAGIGGWPLALRLAGVPDDEPGIWTGSCPCQPFSSAGKRAGTADERHLWPAFFRLIDACRPRVVYGEQVASADVLGKAGGSAQGSPAVWLDGVFADLEGASYTVGAVDLPAACVGSPNIRQRIFWVADASAPRLSGAGQAAGIHRNGADTDAQRRFGFRESPSSGDAGRLAHADGGLTGNGRVQPGREHGQQPQDDGPDGGLEHATGDGWVEGRAEPSGRSVASGCGPNGMGLTGGTGSQGHAGYGDHGNEPGREPANAAGSTAPASGVDWSNSITILCRDGKARRIPASAQPVLQRVFNGLSDIMGDGWNPLLREIQKEVIHHAKKTNTRPGQMLRTLWRAYAAEVLRHNTGGSVSVQEPQVLLLALCELARRKEFGLNHPASDFASVCEATVRTLRRQGSLARSPQERGLDGPPAGESGNALHSLPLACGTQAGIAAVHGLRGEVQTPSDVSEALPAVEEVWRSFADSKASARDAQRIRDGAGVVVALDGFPLAGKVPNRVGLLRGFGNAINPYTAAEFIRACREICG